MKNQTLFFWVLVLGVPLFLLMEHPWIFFLVLVPVAVFGIIRFVMWLKK